MAQSRIIGGAMHKGSDIETDKQDRPKAGRPRRGPTMKTGLALTPEAAEALDGLAAKSGAPKWEVVDRLILAAAASGSVPAPKAAQGLAGEAADFLAAYPDQRKAEKALMRAWSAAKAMAKHDMGD